ncbi:replication fork protection component Swi3-domain-containing protein [Lentinula aff. detonsa]|uniref:Chromosome segregation in meiosis protein n=1 Tax=Lentinula aff. detonsa TaxID=2804958 RepID=A0AA38L0C1_9AGAR|nr:replication fork protection component Swi3-domain-containing protein [Lentinula aff. detonsa]
MDIFDDDNDVEVISRPSTSTPAASSTSSQPLFLPDHDEDEDLNEKENEKVPPAQQEVEDIFNSVVGYDLNFDYVPLARNRETDYDNFEREAQKKAKVKVPRHQILSSSPPPPDIDDDAKSKKGKRKDDGEKERRKPMRLDEARLVGPTGFPQLIEDTKHFRIKGKGHEATDLNRLLQIYQYWTHRMYPKSQFKDTVERVERLSHSKLMHNKLSMWRDEAHGKAHPETEDEVVDDNADDGPITHNIPEEVGVRSSVAPESDAAAYASSSSPPTRPPSSAAPSNAGDGLDDQYMEELWKEMEKEQANETRQATAPTRNSANGNENGNTQPFSKGGVDFMDVDDDIEGWLALEETMDSRSLTSTTASTGLSASSKGASNTVTVAVDNDDEMWEMRHEIETENAIKQVHSKETSSEMPSRLMSTTEEDFDDMYH